MRTLRKQYTRQVSPGVARTLTTSNMSADYCDVTVVEEGITLRFERCPDGTIRCGGHTREHSDAGYRATRSGFEQARRLAVGQMNKLRDGETVRTLVIDPIVENSSIVECTMSYAGNQYSYSCLKDKPLTWENLWLSAVFTGKGNMIHLTPEEERKLKQRAFSKIKVRRAHEGYSDNGEGEYRPPAQLTFSSLLRKK